MKTIISSRLPLNDAQLFALYNFLVKDSLKGVKICFIVDAVGQIEDGLPEWVYRDAEKFKLLGAEVVLCNLCEDDINQKILEADILFFEGGSTLRLLQAIKDSQIMNVINSDICDNKIWFGISAGGCVLSKKCYSSCEKWFAKEPGEELIDGLCKNGDFVFIPHFKSKDFRENTEENLTFVKEKLDDFKAIIGADSCVVTGILKNSIFEPNQEVHEAILVEKIISLGSWGAIDSIT